MGKQTDEKWYWIELIGFDRTQADYGVGTFLSRLSGGVRGVSLLLYSIDFVNTYEGFCAEKPLLRSVCSYGGHAFNEERAIQPWTSGELKALIDELHKNGVVVLLSLFDLYTYTDEAGCEQSSTFAETHPELRTFCSAEFRAQDAILIMKHFCDGRPYNEFFIEKVTALLTDYGFDGLHLADGLSSLRFCIQSGDFSDDVMFQFQRASGVQLPHHLQGKCDDNRRKHLARYRYVMEHLRYDFTCFVAQWFAEFYEKLATMLHKADKTIIFNIAWTRDPFEALFRYGIDYKRLAVHGIGGMMIEDVGSSWPLLSAAGLGGFYVPTEKRRFASHMLHLTQLTTKAHVPELRQFNMTPLKDTQEDWNMIDAAPFEVHKMIVRRKNSWLTTENEFKRASEGAFYCLSDGLPKEKWDMIATWEHFAELPDITGVMGFTAVWESASLYRELKRFINERKPAAKQLLEQLVVAGIPISSVVRAENLAVCRSPLFVPHADLMKEETIMRLERFSGAVMVLMGYGNPLKRQADCVVAEGESGLCAHFYNCPTQIGKNLDLHLPSKPISCGYRDAHGGIWTAELRYEKPKVAFLKEVKKRLEALRCYPVVINGADCRIMAYTIGEHRALLLVSNDSYAAEDAAIRFPYLVKDVRSYNKPSWYKVPHRGEVIMIHINNRAMEVLEVVF